MSHLPEMICSERRTLPLPSSQRHQPCLMCTRFAGLLGRGQRHMCRAATHGYSACQVKNHVADAHEAEQRVTAMLAHVKARSKAKLVAKYSHAQASAEETSSDGAARFGGGGASCERSVCHPRERCGDAALRRSCGLGQSNTRRLRETRRAHAPSACKAKCGADRRRRLEAEIRKCREHRPF